MGMTELPYTEPHRLCEICFFFFSKQQDKSSEEQMKGTATEWHDNNHYFTTTHNLYSTVAQQTDTQSSYHTAGIIKYWTNWQQ